MAGGLKSRGIESLSGNIANVNTSGQLAVEAVVNVGAVSAGISGQLVYAAGRDKSGVFVPLPVTLSGAAIFDEPYRLVVAFSGDSVMTSISGDTVIAKISGETVSVAGGVSVSGNVINTSVSGNIVNITNQAVRISGETVNVGNFAGLSVSTSVSGNVVVTNVSGNVLVAQTSGSTAYLVSGQNTVQLTSGLNSVRISGDTVIAKISGETIIASISGQTVVTNIDLSGVTLNVDNLTVNISGQVTKSEISGQKVRFGDSGFSYVQLQAFDYTNTTFRNVASDASGVVSVTANVVANISGQTVRTFAGSGQNAVYITNQSGTLPVVMDASGRMAVTNSGAVINIVSGAGVRVSGETISVLSGLGVRVSGETLTVNGTVAVTSGTGVRISGETVAVTSGTGVRTSGETMAIWSGSGRNPIYITNQSGTLPVIIDASGKINANVSGSTIVINQTVTATVSGNAVNVSGNVVSTSVSGNVLSVSVSGNVVSVSGGVAKVSGETISFPSGLGVRVSGEVITAVNVVSGNTPIASLSTISGVAMLSVEPTKTFFMAYQTLMITSASGGAALLSGDSRVLLLKNIGQSGSVMFVGSSGTSRAPWVATEFSGWGWQLKDGDSITIPVFNPAVVRVVSLTSGQPVSYAINNY